ncbi:CHRD domain-containing protein [bacterium]|nr:CHRD domain-containing protein [bacterium]
MLALFVLLMLAVAGTAAAAPGNSRNFVAHLSGDNEVPNAVITQAQGQAIFHVSKDGSEISYKLIVANIEDVRMAHIHLAPAGSNGPVVAWLYPSAPPLQLIPGRTNGILMQGTLRAANLTGALAGATIADLVDAMAAGNTYVNVHTVANPGGEIRGQIR